MGVRLSVLGCVCVGKRFLSPPPPHKREGEEGETLPLSSPVSPPLLPFSNGAGGKGERFLSCLFFGGGGSFACPVDIFRKFDHAVTTSF